MHICICEYVVLYMSCALEVSDPGPWLHSEPPNDSYLCTHQIQEYLATSETQVPLVQPSASFTGSWLKDSMMALAALLPSLSAVGEDGWSSSHWAFSLFPKTVPGPWYQRKAQNPFLLSWWLLASQDSCHVPDLQMKGWVDPEESGHLRESV